MTGMIRRARPAGRPASRGASAASTRTAPAVQRTPSIRGGVVRLPATDRDERFVVATGLLRSTDGSRPSQRQQPPDADEPGAASGGPTGSFTGRSGLAAAVQNLMSRHSRTRRATASRLAHQASRARRPPGFQNREGHPRWQPAEPAWSDGADSVDEMPEEAEQHSRQQDRDGAFVRRRPTPRPRDPRRGPRRVRSTRHGAR